ncbi:MAG: primosomal protein N' [Rhodobacteraceae bacterium]|nr:primosomal protein N' [Paracoccaceae bacterium]
MPQTAAPDFFDEGTPCAVLTTEPVGSGVLDYLAPEGGCWLGAFVDVPLGPRRVVGVVWGTAEGKFARNKLRQVIRVLDAAPLRAELRDFLTRVADYTLTPLPAMLRLATRVPGLGDGPATRKLLFRGPANPPRMTDARERVLAALDGFGGAGLTPGELAQVAGVSAAVVRGLVKTGGLVERDAPRDQPYAALNPALPRSALSEDQAQAARHLRDAMAQDKFGATLLKGVTGSGKTEVYLEAIAACLARGRQALVLLPEIALTSEFLTRVEGRFGARPAEWHSGVTVTERRRCWRMVAQGDAQLVVGARSALFLPFRDLGLVVVDEEHDTSYKQEEGALYNARDMAVLRASLNGAQAVLASATPSLESWANAASGKYARLDLATRFGPNTLPDMRAIDLRAEELPSNRWISPSLQRAVTARVQAGEQALLFLNRRGYAPLTLCRACGHQVGCTDCDARMVEHRFLKRLVCHQCGATAPIPTTCPACGAEDRMAPVGPGVERLEEEARALWPDARVLVLSSDLFGSARALKEHIAAIANGAADIIIGTQIVAKGHNFPLLTLVGVIDADLGLSGSDLRAAERVFQLVRQVAGRAGRAEKAGLALVQTSQPDHPVIRAILSGDEETFWRTEAEARFALGMPPYGRLAGIIVSSTKMEDAFALGQRLAMQTAPLARIGAQVFGPAPAPIARIRGRHRVRLLVKAPKGAPLQAALRAWAAPHKLARDLRLSIDIDPQSFL